MGNDLGQTANSSRRIRDRRANRAAVGLAVVAGCGLAGFEHVARGEAPRGANPAPGSPKHSIICTQYPVEADRDSLPGPFPWDADADLRVGSRLAWVDDLGGQPRVSVLTEGFAAVGRSDLSFDGEHVLFVGQRGLDDPPAVWEMQLRTRQVRRVTDCVGECSEAIYLGQMFDRRSDEPYRQIAFRSRRTARHAGALFTCRLDGTGAQRITYHPERVHNPLLLSDGRLLFVLSSMDPGSPAGTATAFNSRLMTINTDGTELFPFAGVDGPAAIRSAVCETGGDRVIFVELDAESGVGNRLVAVRRTRSLSTHRVLAAADGGSFQTPTALPEGGILVSYRPSGGGTYGVHRVRAGGETALVQVFDDPDWDDLAPIVVRPRREPPGRSSVVDERSSEGQLYGLDVYLSDPKDGIEVQPGRIKTLRVFQATGADAARCSEMGSPGDAPRGNERLLGEAPVEADGSFFVDVPARTPLRVETLDGDGRVVRGMKRYFWVMPNERRGCIGCHEDRELTPPNRHVLALRRRASRLVSPDSETATLTRPSPYPGSPR